MLCMFAWVLAATLVAPARAADPTPGSAAQAVALFLQSCVRYAGDTAGLRQAVQQGGYPEVPADHADEYLDGLPGAAYDVSGGQLALVLVSQDSGSCSVLADGVRGADVIKALEAGLRVARIVFTATDDAPEPQTGDLNNREYAASRDQQSWHMLVSTVKDPAGGTAILTTNP
ncbi:MAG TPA: hypothetical protein VFW75_05410 [Acetobacteraceae bacterium]|nr:hypothetical protein [Acetobacteraceae bacterium]